MRQRPGGGRTFACRPAFVLLMPLSSLLTLTAASPAVTCVALPGSRLTVWLGEGPGADDLDAALPPPAFAPWLFQELPHARQQMPAAANRLLLAALVDERRRRTVGRWLVWPDPAVPGYATSPGRAPFGGPQLAPGLEPADVQGFVEAVLTALRARGYRHLRLKLPPAAYDIAGHALLTQALLGAGLHIGTALLNQFVPTAQVLEARLHPSARRRLLKSRRLGLTFGPEPAAALPELYGALADWRIQRGHQLSLTETEVADLLARLPSAFQLYAVRTAAGPPAAVVVAVRVSAEVLYYFLPASDPALNALSPAVLLVAGLHTEARNTGAALLDLGTSADPVTGRPSHSLLRFKRHLGGLPTLKLTLEGEIN